MAFKLKYNNGYDIDMVAGDDEYIRLTVKDDTGAVIDVSTDVDVVLGIKRERSDTTFLIPEVTGTTYTYDAVTQPYTIEFLLDSDSTVALLEYEGKKRDNLSCYYDIELHNTHLGADTRTTILSGLINISRSIAGKVS